MTHLVRAVRKALERPGSRVPGRKRTGGSAPGAAVAQSIVVHGLREQTALVLGGNGGRRANGRLFGPDDSIGFAQVIVELLSDQRLGRAAKEALNSDQDSSKLVAQQLEELYLSVTGEPRR